MPQQPGTLETIATTLARLLEPLGERLAAGEIRLLLAELGLEFPPEIETSPALTSATQVAVQQAERLPRLAADLASAVESEDATRILVRGVELANAVRVLIQETDNVASGLEAAGAGTGIPPAELSQFADELPGRLVDYLVAKKLEALPGAAPALEFTGVLERSKLPAVDAQHPAYVRRRLHVEELTSFLTDPAAHLRNKYQWGAPGFTGGALLETLQRLLSQTGVPAILDPNGPVLDVLFLEVRPKTDIDPPGLVIDVADRVRLENAGTFGQDDWEVRLVLDTQAAVGSQVIVQPNDGVTFAPPTGRVEGDVYGEWLGGDPNGQPYLIFGQTGGSRVEARQMVARVSAGFAWNPATNQAEGVLTVGGEVKHGRIVVSLDEADGFLGKIFAGFGLNSDFDFGFGFSTKDGVFFHGSSTLDIQLPLHVTLGPVEVNALTLTVGMQDDEFPIGAATDVKAILGPLQAVVQQVGIRAALSFPADLTGTAGPVDFALAFKPPDGVGLAIDTPAINGGGYLFIDAERGEYAGALELTFSNAFALKAIGLITTKMPDGSRGFSLLIIITAEFGTGIQLGFGFTLLAVGGLIGLNRTMKLQPLMDGVRTGAVNSIMFPRDVVANAPRIISDLRTIFPPQEGTFLIGPMAKLAWGTPPLISLSLGIIIEIPGNIAILGVLRMALPVDKAAVLVLQVNFAGAIEFDKRRIYFFATLFESRMLFMTIDGEMALLVVFGDNPNFVASVGGFHPGFTPPPLPVPSPHRVSVNLVNSPFARIRIEGYFAVTSNTAQFGARAELFFGLDEISVRGHLGFDALFQFSPFYVIIAISASFSVDVFGAGLFSVRIRGSLEGPTPWRASGEGSISLLFFDISVDFAVTWGESRDTTLPPIAVMPLFKAEFEKDENWRALLPVSNNLMIALRKMPPGEDALVLHPVGVLRVTQRALPLELKIDKVGNQKPNDVNRLSVAVTDGTLSKRGDTFEQFAPAQFENLNDGDRLSRPAFEPERAGLDLSVAGGDLRSSGMVKRVVRYEEIILDTNFKRFVRRFFPFNSTLFGFFLNGASVAKSDLSLAKKKQFQPFEEKIDVQPETYTVAYQSNNRAYAADSVSFASEASARDFLARAVAKNANLTETLHVIPSYEGVA